MPRSCSLAGRAYSNVTRSWESLISALTRTWLVSTCQGSLPCGRFLLAPLNGNKEGSKCLMVLRVKHTPARLPTNSLCTSMDNTPLHSISRVCHPYVLAFWYRSQSSTDSPHRSAGWCSSHSGECVLRSPQARKRLPGSVVARTRVS